MFHLSPPPPCPPTSPPEKDTMSTALISPIRYVSIFCNRSNDTAISHYPDPTIFVFQVEAFFHFLASWNMSDVSEPFPNVPTWTPIQVASVLLLPIFLPRSMDFLRIRQVRHDRPRLISLPPNGWNIPGMKCPYQIIASSHRLISYGFSESGRNAATRFQVPAGGWWFGPLSYRQHLWNGGDDAALPCCVMATRGRTWMLQTRYCALHAPPAETRVSIVTGGLLFSIRVSSNAIHSKLAGHSARNDWWLQTERSETFISKNSLNLALLNFSMFQKPRIEIPGRRRREGKINGRLNGSSVDGFIVPCYWIDIKCEWNVP